MIFNISGGGSTGDPIPKVNCSGLYEMRTKGRDWEIILKSSGTITFTDLGSADSGVDIFLVGGGGNGIIGLRYAETGQYGSLYTLAPQTGGGGGYTTTVKNLKLLKGIPYSFTIGVGGKPKQLSAGGGYINVGDNAQIDSGSIGGETSFALPSVRNDTASIETGYNGNTKLAGYRRESVGSTSIDIFTAPGGMNGFYTDARSSDYAIEYLPRRGFAGGGGNGGSICFPCHNLTPRGHGGQDGEKYCANRGTYFTEWTEESPGDSLMNFPRSTMFGDLGKLDVGTGQKLTTIAYGDGDTLFTEYERYSYGGSGLLKNGQIPTAPGSGGASVGRFAYNHGGWPEDKGEWQIPNYDGGSWWADGGYPGRDGAILIRPHKSLMRPKFTYTGRCELCGDGFNSHHWKIKFLTSGILNFSDLGWLDKIDIFLVGGGGSGANYNSAAGTGGGGGGGYTNTYKNITIQKGVNYNIVIGNGGGTVSRGLLTPGNGGTSSCTIGGTTYSAAGGAQGNGVNGGAGGSGGGGAGTKISGSTTARLSGGAGGSNGGNGATSSNSSVTLGAGGAGQGRTTREFGEASGELYGCGGGGGAGNSFSGGAGGTYAGEGGSNTYGSGQVGFINTGAGGGGAGEGTSGINARRGGQGGSGIVIIRDAR